MIGYWIAAPDHGEGIVHEVNACIAEAVDRGIDVKIIIDEQGRRDGHGNSEALVAAWPQGVAFPSGLTWRLPAEDRHLKLHAKVLVAGRRDGSVTPANLTFYALDRNMEMGVRVLGAAAGSIADHFHRMIDGGVLEKFPEPAKR